MNEIGAEADDPYGRLEHSSVSERAKTAILTQRDGTGTQQTNA